MLEAPFSVDNRYLFLYYTQQVSELIQSDGLGFFDSLRTLLPTSIYVELRRYKIRKIVYIRPKGVSL